MRGDIDGDGKITQNDVDQINKHVGGIITLTGADLWCADTTGDNKVNVADFVQLSRYPEGKTTILTSTPTFADFYNNWTYHKVDDLTGYWTAEITINGLKATSDAIVNIGNDEGIFYKSELSDGAIRFYATRPPIAEVSATITFKPGTGVITTSYESAKFHAATHSKDGADPITPTAIGAVGYDAAQELTDEQKAQARANIGADTVQGAVRYDVAQSLTDGQKTQARGNINAAPDGHGLGDTTISEAPNKDANKITTTGWYMAAVNTPAPGWWLISSITYGDTRYQFAYANEGASSILNGTVSQRSQKGASSGWTPWEYVNPPMKLGVEYRTTERYLGKPVYVKLIDCGNLPNGTTKEVAHGITNLDFMVGAQAIASNSTSGFNGHTYLPEIYNGSLTDRWTNYLAGIDPKNIRIFCGGGLAGCLVYVTFKYTKTTD